MQGIIGRVSIRANGIFIFDLGIEWRFIEGAPNYQVNNIGQVRSLDHPVLAGYGSQRVVRGRVLSPQSGAYLRVSLHIAGRKQITRSVHTLVMRAFVGLPPKGHEVRHLVPDTSNNRLTNLAYGTSAQNSIDTVLHGNHVNANLTACRPKGHSYTPENTILERRGDKFVRRCRTCRTPQKRAIETKRVRRTSPLAVAA